MLTQNQVIHGDCIQVLRSLPSATVDLVITDPPYFVRYKDRAGRSIANDANPDSVLGAFTDLYRVLKPDTFCVSFYGWNSIAAFLMHGRERASKRSAISSGTRAMLRAAAF